MPNVPIHVCLVCLGNICRSPTAEAVLRARLTDAGLADAVTVSSAGTGSWHVGRPADRRAMQALTARGYRLDHRARQYAAHWFDEHDIVVAMDRSNRDDLLDLAPDDHARAKVVLLREFDPSAVAAGELDVPDPYYGGDDGFDRVLDVIERGCEGLVEHLRTRVG